MYMTKILLYHILKCFSYISLLLHLLLLSLLYFRSTISFSINISHPIFILLHYYYFLRFFILLLSLSFLCLLLVLLLFFSFTLLHSSFSLFKIPLMLKDFFHSLNIHCCVKDEDLEKKDLKTMLKSLKSINYK